MIVSWLRRGSPLYQTQDCRKKITTWAQEPFRKLRMILLWSYLQCKQFHRFGAIRTLYQARLAYNFSLSLKQQCPEFPNASWMLFVQENTVETNIWNSFTICCRIVLKVSNLDYINEKQKFISLYLLYSLYSRWMHSGTVLLCCSPSFWPNKQSL